MRTCERAMPLLLKEGLGVVRLRRPEVINKKTPPRNGDVSFTMNLVEETHFEGEVPSETLKAPRIFAHCEQGEPSPRRDQSTRR